MDKPKIVVFIPNCKKIICNLTAKSLPNTHIDLTESAEYLNAAIVYSVKDSFSMCEIDFVYATDENTLDDRIFVSSENGKIEMFLQLRALVIVERICENYMQYVVIKGKTFPKQ